MSDKIDAGLTVRFRGVRGSIPSPGKATSRYGGNTSCVEVRCNGHLLILDAGSGIRGLGIDLLEEFGDQPVQADLLISHTHWDHIQGLPFFAPAYSARNRIQVYGAPGLTTHLKSALRNQMEIMHFPVGFDQLGGLAGIRELNPGCSRLGPFHIRTTALNHPGGCAGFRIETEFGALAYLPDHEPFRSSVLHADNAASGQENQLIDFLRGVDLLILDTQYLATEYARHVGWGHGCLPDSVSLAMQAEVGQLAFYHHDPCHDDDQIDRMLESGRKLAADGLRISAATECQTIVIDRSSGRGGVAEAVAGPLRTILRPTETLAPEGGAILSQHVG